MKRKKTPDKNNPLLLPSPAHNPNEPLLNSIPVEELLVQIDDFERAIEAAKLKKNFKAVIEGVELIQRNFLNILKTREIIPFSAENNPFDPNLHEVVEDVRDSAADIPIVLTTFRKGYRKGPRILRKALVKIGSEHNPKCDSWY